MLGQFDFKGKSEEVVTKKLNKLKQQIFEDKDNYTALEKAIEFETIKLILEDYEVITKR